MTRGGRRGVLVLVLAALLVGCGGPAHDWTPGPPEVSPGVGEFVPLTDVPHDQLVAMRADLAARGLDPTRVHVVDAAATTWPDASWGCPQPGQVYAQVVEPGFKFVVQVDDRTYDYRFGTATEPIVCPG